MAGSIKVAGHELVSHDIANDKLIYGTGVPAGTVIQVVQHIMQSSWTAASNQNEQLIGTGATIFKNSITPKKENSKILIQYAFDTSASSANTGYSYIEREIGSGTGFSKLNGAMGTLVNASNHTSALSHAGNSYASYVCDRQSGIYLDEPTYSLNDQISYQIGVRSESSARPVIVGATARNNTLYHPKTASMIITMEISQ